VNDAARRSPRNPFRVVIHKSRGTLELFRDGVLLKRIAVHTGKNPADKRIEGDMATPEGEFYICYKNPRSRYTRFLGLSYPNTEDAERGLREGIITQAEHRRICGAILRRQCPPWKTALGGEVGIHGRSSSVGWTHGCIAMKNAEILKLSKLLPLGTPVQIFR
jgi:murein L,D-transpeptidase YafK